MNQPPERGIDRRAFVKTAVAIGGASALAACTERSTADLPAGAKPSALPARQHAWNRGLATDDAGNHVPPTHRLLLLLDYDGAGRPSGADRHTVRTALDTLDRAYEWSHNGLLSVMAYSPAYFDRFQTPIPDSIALPGPQALASFEEPTLDTPDAILYLASDHGKALLAAEQALRGKQDSLNDISVDTTLTDAFSVAARRTGFKGAGQPADHQDTGGVPDSDPVPEDAPLYMGFKSNYTDSQATEDRVTIESGPFANGTTAHVSAMRLNLDQWYGQDDRYQRVGKMFCPYHAEHDVVDGVGESLGASAEMGKAKPARRAASEDALVGHSQKMVSLRENGRPLILRRDFDSTDGDHAGFHFVSFQRRLSEFVETRTAMNGEGLADSTAVGQRNNNGILQYIDVTNRGNYLVPPRSSRALPWPRGDDS